MKNTKLKSVGPLDVRGLRQNVLALEARSGPPGNFTWDRWEKLALQAGLSAELADLGRSVIRDAYQHGWDEDLMRECGWLDGGLCMIVVALAQPDKAAARWEHLMHTNGEPDDSVAPPVSTETCVLLQSLEARGINYTLMP